MLLSDEHIMLHMRLGNLDISPFDAKDVQPASVDMHLGDTFELFTHQRSSWEHPYVLDPRALPEGYTTPHQGSYRLDPGDMILGSTQETVRLHNNLAARLEGKSSLGRIGLGIHVTAGFIDPGFHGTITLEIVNHSPYSILLIPGMPIGQLCLFLTSGAVSRPYGSEGLRSRYQGQAGATPSRGVDQQKH